VSVSVGDQVRHIGGGDTGVVLRVDGTTAHVSFPRGKDYVPIDDLELASDEPQDQLARGHIGDPTAAHLKLLAGIVAHAYAYDPASALLNARLEPKLHQAFVAHRVVNKIAPRMILADEVGLGKTIEAGLVIKELRARKRISRILIVTPASLSRQWQSELKTKFNESFEIIDGPAAKHFGRGGKNPFEASGNLICSYQFATSGSRPEQIVEAGWDMVVFDEAHRVRRTGTSASSRRVTAAYKLADELRDQVDGLLLLSATPVQLHAYELFSLVDLVEPGLFPSFEAFERVREKLPKLNELMRALLKWETLDQDDKLMALVSSAGVIVELNLSPEMLDSEEGRREVERRLTARHPLADSLIRNRKAHLGIQGERRAEIRWVNLSNDELEVHERVVEYLKDGYRLALGQKNNAVGFLMVTYLKMLTSSSHALRTSLRRRISVLQDALAGDAAARSALKIDDDIWDAEESSEVLTEVEMVVGAADRIQIEVEVLEDLVEELADIRDSKIRDLIDLMGELGGQKVVLFTQFIETQLFLEKALEANGVQVSVFNGRMNADAKEAAIRAFRTRTQVLISTESGGEGRNLQFAHVLVNYDLPWNPMKIEQRIGRLDRIGQTEPVHIYNMVCRNTLDERIIEVLNDRIKLFVESVGALDPILGTVEKSIASFALGSEDAAVEFREFAEDLDKKVAEARLLERTMADFVLDQASFRRDEANELLGRRPLVSTMELRASIELGLEYLGGRLVPHEEGGETFTLAPRLASRIGAPTSSPRGVFDPVDAVRMDDVDFFACGHPLVDRVLAGMSTLEDAATGCRISGDVPEGLWVEVIREVSSRVGAGSGRLVRHLVGPDGQVVSNDVEKLPLLDVPVSREAPDWAGDAVRQSDEFFRREFEEFVADAKARFIEDQGARRERLERIYGSQHDRLAKQIESEDAWLAARRTNPSDRDRKILPAREKKLELARRRLAELKDELELDVDQLLSEQPDIRARVLSAAVLEGR